MSNNDEVINNSNWRGQSSATNRMSTSNVDLVEPGCATCRVNMDLLVCRQASMDHNSCPIARGRFKSVFRAGAKKIGSCGSRGRHLQLKSDKRHLSGCLEQFSIEQGKIAKLQLERTKIVKDMAELGRALMVPDEAGQVPDAEARRAAAAPLRVEVEAIDKRIREHFKFASQYGRECGVNANVNTGPAPAFDTGVFGE